MTALGPPDFLYGTAWKEERTAALVELALRAGFRGIDTANQRRHYWEAGVGEGLAAACREGVVTRGDIFLQTKFTYRPGQDHRLPYDPQAALALQVAQSLASSLEHLGTERDAGRTRLLGVSNVSLRHLAGMMQAHGEGPAFVQNRCFARTGWDREVRRFCHERKIGYQGFSLLTANVEVLRHPVVARIASRVEAGVAQVVFAFARSIGMLPLTGTTSAEHMKIDLESREIELTVNELREIEGLAG